MNCNNCIYCHACPDANFQDNADTISLCLDFKSVRGSRRSVISIDESGGEDMYD